MDPKPNTLHRGPKPERNRFRKQTCNSMRQLIVWSLVVIAMGALATPHVSAANVSDLYGDSGEKWNPAGRLPDFSWAGYRSGEPVPAVPVKANVKDFGAKGDGNSDDTRAFQEALATVKSGAILIPEGRYRITGILEITKPNIVFHGEGEGATVLFLEKPLKDLGKEVPYYGGLIRIMGKDNGRKITDVTSGTRRGGTRLAVRSAQSIRAGQIIRLRMRNPQDNSLGRYLYADQGALNAERRKWYDGQIVNWAVPVKSVADGVVELARPLRLDVRPQWQPEIWSHQPTVHDVGIENLTIEFPNAQYAGHHKEEGYFAIYLNGAYDCWVRNLTIIDSDIGVVVYAGGRNEVNRVTLNTRRRTGGQTAGETGHYGLVATSHAQDSLFENCRLETTFEHNLSYNAFANGNVYSSITCQTGRFDHHGGAPYENLFTDILITKNAGDFFMSGGNRADEPNAGARTTFWNVRTQGGKFPGKIMVHADGSPRLPQVNIIGMDRWPAKKTATEEWIEQWPGETTQPPNLYRAQRAERTRRQSGAAPTDRR